MSESLEEKSLWFKYKTEVWPKDPLASEEAPSNIQGEAATIHNIMRVIRSIRTPEMAYLSSPITSGRKLYELQIGNPQTNPREFMKDLIYDNYRDAYSILKNLESETDIPIVFPADLVPAHQKWEQAHFQALWLSIIAEKCTHLYMAKDWPFSNGCVEEFTHTWQLRLGMPHHPQLVFYNTKEEEESSRERMRNIKVLDHKGNPISLETGIYDIESSVGWIEKNGFTAPKITNCLSLLSWTRQRIDEGFYQ